MLININQAIKLAIFLSKNMLTSKKYSMEILFLYIFLYIYFYTSSYQQSHF